MTVAFNDSYTQYTGTGARTFFEFGFPILDGSAVYVLVDNLPAAFTMQTTGVVIEPAPVLNAVVEIFRWTNVDQLSNFEAFESFDAEKTEDAVDKLIMLKQEGWHRGAMNLLSDPQLDMVILVNDKGENAHILIWNEHTAEGSVVNDAGVFAGEVTQDMPCPGAVVAKPDHFVYFQYGDVGQEVFLTSRPYPLEFIDGFEAEGTAVKGRIFPAIVEGYEATATPVSGSLQTVLEAFTYETEGYEAVATPVGGNIRVAIKSFTYETEGYEATAEPQGGTLRTALVQHTYETEGYEATATPIGGNLT
jgi:hypothetical protein